MSNQGKGIGGNHSPKSQKYEWLTPQSLLACLGKFDLDPCAPEVRPWKTADFHLTEKTNGLRARWHGRVFCNPPYGAETSKWLARCANHRNATALIFARTETACWQNHVWAKADSILFIYGRLTFFHVDGTKAKGNSGAPSALISYDANNTEFLKKSGIKGKLIKL